MKTLITIILLTLIGVVSLIGFNVGDENLFGGVRGGARTGFHTMPGEDIAIGTSTAIQELTVAGDIYTTGYTLTGTVYHAYGGITATSVTIALTKNEWATTTNPTGNLFSGLEADGFTLSNDVLTITNAGDYSGALTISINGGVGNDYEFRFYNLTQAEQEGYTVYGSVGAAADYLSVTLPIYFEVDAGDELVFQVRNITDNDDIIITAGIFYIQYLH